MGSDAESNPTVDLRRALANAISRLERVQNAATRLPPSPERGAIVELVQTEDLRQALERSRG